MQYPSAAIYRKRYFSVSWCSLQHFCKRHRDREVWEKNDKVWYGGRGFKKSHFASDLLFEWPLKEFFPLFTIYIEGVWKSYLHLKLKVKIFSSLQKIHLNLSFDRPLYILYTFLLQQRKSMETLTCSIRCSIQIKWFK